MPSKRPDEFVLVCGLGAALERIIARFARNKPPHNGWHLISSSPALDSLNTVIAITVTMYDTGNSTNSKNKENTNEGPVSKRKLAVRPAKTGRHDPVALGRRRKGTRTSYQSQSQPAPRDADPFDFSTPPSEARAAASGRAAKQKYTKPVFVPQRFHAAYDAEKWERPGIEYRAQLAAKGSVGASLETPITEMVGLGFSILAESSLHEDSPEPEEYSEATYLLLASYWPSPKHPHCKSLPYELWERILLCYCGHTGGFSTIGFDSARYELCQKFGWWSTFIRYNTVFWTRVFVDFTSRPGPIARHIANIGTRPLSIEIDLDLAFTVVPGHTVNSSSFSEVMPCLKILAATSRQWRDLTIYVNGEYFLVPIFNLLNSLDVQSLVTFHYQCPYLAGGIAVRESHRRPIFFDGNVPSLRYMTLTSAIIPWMPTYFSSLISLRLIRLIHLPVSFWPTDIELVRALSASPSLEFLEICGSGVSDMVQSPVFSLPSLTTLTLSYGSSSLLRFFALADLPRISRLVITRFNEDLLELLKDKLWFMGSLESLRINGGFYDDYHVDLLMCSAPNVRELCVKHSDTYFKWIVQHSPSHFSNLEELTVGDVCPYSLLDYVCRHGGIVRLVYHHEPLGTSDFLLMVCIRHMVREFVTYPDVFALTEKLAAFARLWLMSTGVTSSLAEYVQLVPVFSVEIISAILVLVALDRDLSADSIISGAKDICNVSLTCKHFRAICQAVPEAWVNIPAVLPVSIHVDLDPIWFEKAVRLSRNRPLQIVYKLPLAVSVGLLPSDALRIWSTLVMHWPRWEAFHLIGHHRCRLPYVCVKHLAVTAAFTHSTPNLRALTVDAPTRPFACPQHPPNDPVLVHIEKLQILSSCFALDLPVAGPLNLLIPVVYADLVRLDLDKQPLSIWQHILRYVPRLDELVWRSSNAIVGPAGSMTILLPLLRRLELESVHPLPPIFTPRLQELIVTDQQTAFDGDKFDALVGSDHTHPLRVLDLLHNPIHNHHINFLLEKCQDLTYFSMDTMNRDRSSCFEKLADRIALAYANNWNPRLRVVQFSCVPKFTVTRNRFRPLMRLGFLAGAALILHDVLAVDVALIQSFTTSIPFAILHQVDNTACKSLLTYLDIGNQRGTLVVGLLDQATNLQTLVWRNNDLDVYHRPVVLPLLEQLFIHSLRVAPPVVAYNLVELVVSDSYYSLDDVTFSGLTGGYGVVTTLRYISRSHFEPRDYE
ncbi:hypothetical protein DFH06DRAFT_1484777 [Mycena polygramma]|nr:hypothetical protein DFH06DRAFT_1484777 [Mycena polygramma]